jgi:PAS domain S-box-containing protein
MPLEPSTPSHAVEGRSPFHGTEEAWDIYRLLIENSNDLVGEIDAQGDYVYVNPSYSRALGYSLEELLSKNAFDFIHPQDREKARRELKQQDGTTILRFQHQSGTWKWFDCSFRQFAGPSGFRTVLISRDISARKEAEIKFEVLAALGSRLSAARTQLDAARVIADAAQVLCSWDAFSLDLYDSANDVITPVLMIDEFEGQKKEILPGFQTRAPSPFIRTVLQNGPQRILRKGNDFDATLRPFGDTSRASASLLFVPILEAGQPIGIVSIQSYRINAYSRSDLKLLQLQVLAGHCSGTLARISAVDSLSESQARFEAFMENTPGAAWMKDEFGHYVYANQTTEKLFDKERAEIISKTDTDLLPPDAARTSQKEDQDVRSTGQPVRVEKTVRPDDPSRWFVCKFPFLSPSGRSLVGGVAFDITDQVQMQKSLLASEERFRTLFESAPLAIGVVRGGALRYTNQSYRRMFNLPPEAGTAGRKFLEDISPAARSDLEDYFTRSQSRSDPLTATEVRGVRTAGAEFPCIIQIAPVELPEGPAHLVFITDISDRRLLEAQLFQAQKMESIGRLAGGIAHDFANLLTVIRGHASRLEHGVKNPAPSLDGIIRAAQKATELTKQLLAFSRKQTVQVAETDLNSIINKTRRMLEQIVSEDVTLRVHLGAGLPLVLVDSGLLEQLLLNLAITARDAMVSGGNLTIRTSYISPTQIPKVKNGWEKGAVCLSVQDTGRGIPKEELPNIFEPFFKSRSGTETSLRLSTVYGIVQQHGGRVEAQSEIGVGTRFEILFQAVSTPARVAPEEPRKHSDTTLLVVEDSADLRNLLRELLIDAGYQVMEAATYAAGLQLFESAHDRISLIVADVCLEDGSGRELVRQLRSLKPGLKAILTTGYDPHQMRGKIDLQPDELFLAKPFQTDELLQAIESLLQPH